MENWDRLLLGPEQRIGKEVRQRHASTMLRECAVRLAGMKGDGTWDDDVVSR
jgi:hypothetical protein